MSTGLILSRCIDRAPPLLPMGQVRADGVGLFYGYAARPGIYEYLNPDGSLRRELVRPEVIADQAWLSTVARSTLTFLHTEDGYTPDQFQAQAIGDVDGEVEVMQNGFVRIKIGVRDQAGLAAIRDGMVELSPQYDVYRRPAPRGSVHPEYGPYDSEQVRRLNNSEVALVPRGRGGEHVRLNAAYTRHFDSAARRLSPNATTLPPAALLQRIHTGPPSHHPAADTAPRAYWPGWWGGGLRDSHSSAGAPAPASPSSPSLEAPPMSTATVSPATLALLSLAASLGISTTSADAAAPMVSAKLTELKAKATTADALAEQLQASKDAAVELQTKLTAAETARDSWKEKAETAQTNLQAAQDAQTAKDEAKELTALRTLGAQLQVANADTLDRPALRLAIAKTQLSSAADGDSDARLDTLIEMARDGVEATHGGGGGGGGGGGERTADNWGDFDFDIEAPKGRRPAPRARDERGGGGGDKGNSKDGDHRSGDGTYAPGSLKSHDAAFTAHRPGARK